MMNGIDVNIIVPLKIMLIADRMLPESLLPNAILLGLAKARPNLQALPSQSRAVLDNPR